MGGEGLGCICGFNNLHTPSLTVIDVILSSVGAQSYQKIAATATGTILLVCIGSVRILANWYAPPRNYWRKYRQLKTVDSLKMSKALTKKFQIIPDDSHKKKNEDEK